MFNLCITKNPWQSARDDVESAHVYGVRHPKVRGKAVRPKRGHPLLGSSWPADSDSNVPLDLFYVAGLPQPP